MGNTQEAQHLSSGQYYATYLNTDNFNSLGAQNKQLYNFDDEAQQQNMLVKLPYKRKRQRPRIFLNLKFNNKFAVLESSSRTINRVGLCTE